MNKSVSTKDVKGAKRVNNHPEITAGHPIHKMATKIHAKVKAAHPDTDLTPEDFIDELCGGGDDDE